MGDDRWVEVSPSQFTHEAEGLAIVRDLLPDDSPYRAWSNFEFRDSRGRWHEVDLLVLGRGRLHLVELKYYSGVLRGDDHTWLRPGHRAEDSPLKLARRKSQYLASKLTDALREWAKETGADIPNPKSIVPFVQESVFLHHPGLRCELPEASAIGLYGLDDAETTSFLPGISERLLEEPHRTAIGSNQEQILAALMKRIGLVQRRERTAGSWTITDQALDSGDGWQDWLAHHSVVQQERARIRFQVTPAGAPQSEEQRVRRVAEHEFAVMSRLQHDGILRPKDIVQSELGVGLAFDFHESWQRLDLWMAEQSNGVPLATQLSIIRQVGEALQYAHANKVVHRTLSPRVVWVRPVPGTDAEVKVRLGGWEGVGFLDRELLTHTAVTGVTSLQGADSDEGGGPGDVFGAPEGRWSTTADRARIDVFSLASLTAYIVTRHAPAPSPTAMVERLRSQDGIDLVVELPQISSALRALVLQASRPAPTRRTSDVSTFLSQLGETERAAHQSEETATDPLEALPGARLSGGRFELVRRLGQGSTAVGLLVIDHGSPKAPHRVLKVALHDDAALRLADEAEVIAGLDSPRIVRLVEGPITVDERQALLLESAGEETLGAQLQGRQRLSLDLLDRYGTDLLDALLVLDRAGIDHRDIKPANLGVRQNAGDRVKHLVLFDFSLTRAAASATNAGTPPYLDPFLGGERRAYDSAAERYAAAVVLFEMASGRTPQYGSDPDAAPAAVLDDVTISPQLFDPSLAPQLVGFFTTALAREATDRYQTVDAMRRAWVDVFSAGATTEPDETADAKAAAATLATSLEESGLTARALSALEPERIATVGELLAADPVRIARLRGVANSTSRQINRRIKEWRTRLGDVAAPRHPADSARVEDTLAAAAETLLAVVSGERSASRASLARLVLGFGTDLDAFATQAELGASLPQPVAQARAGQILSELQVAWAADAEARPLLTRLVTAFEAAMSEAGGVLTPAEATERITDLFALGEGETPERRNVRIAEGLVRLTTERIRELRRADEGVAAPLVIRRREGQVRLIANETGLLDLAERLAARADELVSAAGDPASAVVPAARAADELAKVVTEAGVVPTEGLSELRPVVLAGAVSTTTEVTARGDLHHRDLSHVTALRLTFGDGASVESLAAEEIRERVRVRFPRLPALPRRPELDELVREAGLLLTYDESRRTYRSQTRMADTTGLESRQPTVHVGSMSSAADDEASRRAEQSIRTRSFLAIGVPGDRVERLVAGVEARFSGEAVDITGLLLQALRAQADRAGVPWSAVRAADAAPLGTRDRQGLAALVARSWSAVGAAVDDVLKSGRSGPVVLTEAGPLARYDHMDWLAQWTDLGSGRARPVWLVVPQLGATHGAVVDGAPVPLATPAQYMKVDAGWVDALAGSPTVTAQS